MLIPDSTYRIQLHAGFTFARLTSLLDYLQELGISTIYASPITRAMKGSTHGYDTMDPLLLSPEIGTEEELQDLAGLLKERQMSWLQDIVPNHMAFDNSNPWLSDVLEKGRGSVYHDYFDIDWDHPDPALNQKLMAPFLGGQLASCLQRGELQLELVDRKFSIRYFNNVWPITASSYPLIGPLVTSLFNERPQLLEELLGMQHYILTDARLATTRINYRRFFTVNSLICLRMEEEKVFTAYHEKILEWYRKGWLQGLRIDHIDGLADPAAYLRRLKGSFGKDCYLVAEKILQAGETLPSGWQLEGTTGYDFLFLVNEVLTDARGSEELLEFYRQLTNEDAMPEAGTLSSASRYEDLRFEKKYSFLKTYMRGELDNLLRLLIHALPPVTGKTPRKRTTPVPDASVEQLRQARLKEALALLMAAFPVYRIYPDNGPLSEEERAILATAFTTARKKDPSLEAEWSLLQALFEGTDDAQLSRQSLPFRIRFMQFTSPLAAKGIEDTLFYTYNPFISHNEVGDSPAVGGISVDEFHQQMLTRQATLPLSMNATSTHDTKRGEDSRIRLNVLSAIPGEWIAAVTRWWTLNRPLLEEKGGQRIPRPNDEYFIYQSLLGGLPQDLVIDDVFRERYSQHLIKAFREARTITRWESPDEDYERGCLDFAAGLLKEHSPFLEDFLPFAKKVFQRAALYSLSQVLIKLTAPGIPDLYQGAELWDLSFVDPDNRRPVDYELRKQLLKKIKEEEKKGMSALLWFLSSKRDLGAEKLYVILKTLAYRRQHPRLFTEGEYIPLPTHPGHLSYLRRHGRNWLLVVVPLIRKEYEKVVDMDTLTLSLPPNAPVRWKHEFTGQMLYGNDLTTSKEVFAGFPVTLLSATG